MTNRYQNGDEVRVFGTFTSTGGTALDPTVVRCRYQPPGSTTVTRTYSGTTHIVRSSTGSYYLDIVANVRGVWRYRWDSSGSGRAASEGQFIVEPGLI